MKKNDTYRDWMLEDIRGNLDEVCKKELQEALESSPKLREIRKELEELQGLMDTQDYAYSPFFSAKVMGKIEEGKKGNLSLEKLGIGFRWITVPAMALALGLILFSFYEEEKLDFDTLAGTNDVYVENVMIADWSSP